MPVSGVRISWLIVDSKAALAVSPVGPQLSPPASARRRSSSDFSLRSRTTQAKPSTRPPGPAAARNSTRAGNERPSRRRHQAVAEAVPTRIASSSMWLGRSSACSSGVNSDATGACTMSGAWPNRRCAPAFQSAMRPSACSVNAAWSVAESISSRRQSSARAAAAEMSDRRADMGREERPALGSAGLSRDTRHVIGYLRKTIRFNIFSKTAVGSRPVNHEIANLVVNYQKLQ